MCIRDSLKNRIKEAMEADDRKKLDRILQRLYDACKSEKDNEFVSEFGKYLFGNYKAIRNRLIYGEVGSCTEAVSYTHLAYSPTGR